jgi:hypothetical protein
MTETERVEQICVEIGGVAGGLAIDVVYVLVDPRSRTGMQGAI